jgi:hypothetical protein
VCQCDCGNTPTTSASNLTQGRSKSCGCGQREAITKHGLSRHHLYLVLDGMKSRCYNSNNIGYNNYGGRGITVCDKWMDDPCSFIEWGLQNGWEEGLVIDRKEVDKGYSPDNCRFVTHGLSSRNTRLIRASNTSGFNGVSYNKKDGKWLAKIQYRNETYRIGLFDDPKEAALARDAKAIELDAGHPLNFI